MNKEQIEEAKGEIEAFYETFLYDELGDRYDLSEGELELLPDCTVGEFKDALSHDELLEVGKKSYKVSEIAGYYLNKLQWLPELEELAYKGRWEEFSDYAQGHYEVMPEAFSCFYEYMPQEYRRDFVIGCYEHHGDHVLPCREHLKRLPKNGLQELPEEYASLGEMTVYRAGYEEVDEAPSALSWTWDERVARFFLDEYVKRHARYLYRAKIKPCDVIAYTDGREEHEVLQYMGVYDVEVIDRAKPRG